MKKLACKAVALVLLLLVVFQTEVLPQTFTHENEGVYNQYFSNPNNSGPVKYRADIMNNADSVENDEKMPMNTLWRGVGAGFLIGATGGTILGLVGKDWVLDDGTVVPRWQHAIVDAFIVAAPLMVIGGVVGVRQPRSTLSTSDLHVALAGGWSSVMTYRDMLSAFEDSGIDGEIPHWFGYLHYPDGENSSTPYTWNLSLDYNLSKHFSVGLSFNNMVRQEVNQAGHTHTESAAENPENELGVYEFTKGEIINLVGDYIFNPINPDTKSRLEVSAGAGIGLQSILVGGAFGTPDSHFKFREQIVTPYFRAALDYYSRKTLSLQLKFGYRPQRTVDVPEQTDGITTINAHGINYRALEITIGVRRHFKL